MNELRPGMAVNEAARALRRALEPIGAAHEARWLLLSALGCTDAGLLLSGAQPLTQAQAQTLGAQLQRRLAGEPLQYVLGEWEFAGCPLFVGPGALIPVPIPKSCWSGRSPSAKPRGLRPLLTCARAAARWPWRLPYTAG